MSTDIVNIGFSVDSRQVDKGAKALGGLGKQAGKASTATSKLSNVMKGVMLAAAAAITAALWKTIAAHREFSKAVSELSAITGATGRDLQFYEERALSLGSSTTFSATQVVTAFKLIASAKPDLLASKEALAAVTMEVLTLAEASGLDLPTAATAVGGALNQFGKGAEHASRFVNVLAAGAKFGASEINMTAEAMKNVGAVASSIGLSFEEANAGIQALAAVSIKGAEAGTGLRGVLLKLATQSKDEFNPEIVGLEKAMKNLADANLTTSQKTKIFGQESVTAATALISQADSLGELTDKLTATSVATEQARTNTNNLDGDIKAMESAWSGVALTLGKEFDPALRMAVQLMTTIGKSALTIAIGFSDMGNAMGASAAIIVNVIKGIGIAISDVGDMIGAMAAVSAAALSGDLEGAAKIWEARKTEKQANKEKLIALIEESATIMTLREETAQANREKIDGIWAEKSATELALEADIKNAETRKLLKAEAEEIELARIEAKNERDKLAADKKLEDDAKEQERLALLVEKFITDDAAEAERNDAKRERELEAQRDYWETLLGMQKGSLQAGLNFGNAMKNMEYGSALKHASLMLSNGAKSSRAMFNIQKAASLANMAVALPSAVMDSFKNGGGFPWGLIPAGLMAAQGAIQMQSVMSSSFGGGGSAPSVPSGGGASSVPVASGLPAGATATPEGLEAGSKPVRELRVSIDGDGVHSEGMRQFARNLAETIKDMGGADNLVIS